jgi:hypothetical protein
MVEEPSHDPIVTNPLADEDTGNDSGAESFTATTSSPTRGTALSYQTSSRKHPSLMVSARPTMSMASLPIM